MVEKLRTPGMNRFNKLPQPGPILGEIHPSPEQVFEDLWVTLTEARIARATLAKRKISPVWFKTPQKLRDEVEEILRRSEQIRGYVLLPPKLPALRINTAKEMIEAGLQVHSVITQRLQAYAQMQYEARYGNYANGLGQIIKESTAQVMTTFMGKSEPEIQQALNQQILVTGKEQISETRRRWVEAEVPKHDGLVKLIVSRLYRFWGPANIPWEAAFQAGRIGLADALDRYDLSRGSLGAFVNRRIKGEIIDLIRSEAPDSRMNNRHKRKINEVEDSIIVRTGRVPTIEELATVTGMSAKRIQRLRQLPTIVPMSDLLPTILESITDGTHISLADPDLLARPEEHLLALESARERQRLIDSLHAAIALLSPRDAMIIRLYDLGEATLEEVGQRLHVSESRASQLHTQAFNQLQKLMAEDSSLKRKRKQEATEKIIKERFHGKVSPTENLRGKRPTEYKPLRPESLSLLLELHAGKLTEDESRILRLRAGLHDGVFWTRPEIGVALELKNIRVLYLENKALQKLRQLEPDMFPGI